MGLTKDYEYRVLTSLVKEFDTLIWVYIMDNLVLYQ